MKNLWNDETAAACEDDLALRVYTSNLIGQSDELVLHGGGNTSVKVNENGEDILYVKGSGWDLVSIEKEGFAPVKLSTLLEMARLETLSDTDMVSGQKAAMTNPDAPNPSVEAILHALIPFKFVDHTHADAVVTLSNNVNGEKLIEECFPGFLVIPYVMPGFILAHTIYKMTQDFDWQNCPGIILHNHGIFTFDDDAKCSYDKMIHAVTKAEQLLEAKAPVTLQPYEPRAFDLETLTQAVSCAKGYGVTVKVNQSPLALTYAAQPNLKEAASRGVLTPEHIIRTKRTPLVLEERDDIQTALDRYIEHYKEYFARYAKEETMLNPAPNYAVIEHYGVVLFGKNEKEVNVMNDIVEHTMLSVLRANKLGGYKSISEKESFEMEYWELEQAKLKA